MELGAGLSNWIRPSPVDRGAQPAGLDCSETASQPLSQTLWPVHTQQHQLAEDHAPHCCDPVGPDQAPQREASLAVQAKTRDSTEHRREPRPRLPCAGHLIALDEPPDEDAGAAPKPHRQSRPTEVAPIGRLHHGQPELESNRSSGQVAESCRHIVHEVQKLLESHQFDGLCHARITHKLEGPFGISALLGKLNQGT